MKKTKWTLFVIPVISFLFILGVVFIGVDVRLKLNEVEKRANMLSGLNSIQKDLIHFTEDITFFRKVHSEKHLAFLRDKKYSHLVSAEELDPIIAFFSEIESHSHLRQSHKTLNRISDLITFQRSQLSILSQKLKIRWISVFLLGLLGCLFAISSSVFFILFANKTENLVLAKREKEEALKKAEEGKKIKHEFLTIISHELKTYLNAITGLTNLLQERNKDHALDDDLELLQTSNQGLGNIIDNSIDLGDIEMGMVVLSSQSINLSKYLQGVVRSFIPYAQENQVDIHIEFDDDIPMEVIGDPFRLNQILFNLIKNALKFGKNGIVIVSTKLITIKNGKAKIRFAVIDNGIGIDAVETNKIFESFSQANEGITENYGGSGIGLSIIRKLLLIMESEIQLKSEPGQGSVFYFELDMAISEASKKANLSNNRSVLIVDDNKINRIILKRYLDELNLDVEEVSSGELAVQACEKKDYQIIFMDLQMPIMDGIETTKIILANNPDSNTAIFAVSASSKDLMEKKCKDIGFSGFIPKPIDREGLIKIVNQFY